MADQRKSFRPRRLAFGARFLPHAQLFAAGLALCAALVPAAAEEAGLRNGAASLAAGKYDAAVRQLSATINSENASRNDAAQALYLRGIAYRKMGEPARAVSDLGAAIWLGLPENDRVKALVNRGLAYQAAGLSKEGAAEIASARKIGGSRKVDQLIAEGGGAPPSAGAIAAFDTEVRPEASSTRLRDDTATAEPASTRSANAVPESWSTSVSDEAQPAHSSTSGNRLTRWFGSLTDSSGSPPAAQPEPQPAPAPPPPTAQPSRPAPQPKAAQAPTTGWSTTTDTQEASAGASSGGEGTSRWARLFNRTAGSDPQVQPAAAPAASGAYKLQLATSRSEAEAKALWKRVSQTQGLSGVRPEIERVEIGDFGTFYALRIGPFPDKSESLRVCSALKRSGIDCSPAEQ
jgi:tetratricopeptide (TPR) repeat protein